MGYSIVLNRIVLYYGSGKVLRCTIGYTAFKEKKVCHFFVQIAAGVEIHVNRGREYIVQWLFHP
jgi:hypothetical protein